VLDDTRFLRTGFRMDTKSNGIGNAMFIGELYTGGSERIVILPSLDPVDFNPETGTYSKTDEPENDLFGCHLLARFERVYSADTNLSLQTYYTRGKRDEAIGVWSSDIFDVEIQHRFMLSDQIEMIWGTGYRYYTDHLRESAWLSFLPDQDESHIFNFSFQEDIHINPFGLKLTLGSKFEYNEGTGWEVQPTIRFLKRMKEKQAVWGAFSRAVRPPNRQERGVNFVYLSTPTDERLMQMAPFPVSQIEFKGNENTISEELIALELGYRMILRDRISSDIALFYHLYDHLASRNPETPYPEISSTGSRWVVPIRIENQMDAQTYGVELSLGIQPLDRLKLQASYTFFKMQTQVDENATGQTESENDPRHQISVRSMLNLPYDLELDLWIRYVDSVLEEQVSSYVTADARVGWKPGKNIELSIVGRHLLDPSSPEYRHQFYQSNDVEIEREITVNLIYRF